MSLSAFRPNQSQVVQFSDPAESEVKRIMSGQAGAEVQLRLVNLGTDAVHMKVGGDGETSADDQDMTVLAGVTEVLTYQIPESGEVFVAVKGTGSGGTFEVTGGRGL